MKKRQKEYIQKLRSYLVDKKEKPEISRYIYFDNFIYKIVIGDPSRDNINIVKVLMQNANNKNLNGKAVNSFTIADRNLYVYNDGEELVKTEVTFKIDVDLYY
ncbi:hypothetical protein [Dielma fastidiosa]|uniref:Uncharacterized protein n=1 Tax=Dielma fastidiosa TaxID=1034346 RepID=A0AB35UP57_9FIRM|nr:hypothetical protein [Dielma fastidiosa]MDY5168568.1 hypothetical protein [Dielma fastidiosa]